MDIRWGVYVIAIDVYGERIQAPSLGLKAAKIRQVIDYILLIAFENKGKLNKSK